MKLASGHLSYCTNIHSGETWEGHFDSLQRHFPLVKANVAGETAMGIGLRLSAKAADDLQKAGELAKFRKWLQDQNAYVFTMNGFPYGEFHHAQVKDRVHVPDWTTDARLRYTLQLIEILAVLLPDGMDGGISTSPLSYRNWYQSESERVGATEKATGNIIATVEALIRLKNTTGKLIHIDIEPEPDGLLETGSEFISWYEEMLMPMAKIRLGASLGLNSSEAMDAVREHICLCYDVCHFAIGYEPHADILKELSGKNIRVGKIQISAALKADIPADLNQRAAILAEFRNFDEPVYLHQVVARDERNELWRYPDLPSALESDRNAVEWRAHFHVPVFVESFGLLSSTQSDIVNVLNLQASVPFTSHMEVETYTWEVLPGELKRPLADSISRELEWVKSCLQSSPQGTD